MTCNMSIWIVLLILIIVGWWCWSQKETFCGTPFQLQNMYNNCQDDPFSWGPTYSVGPSPIAYQ